MNPIRKYLENHAEKEALHHDSQWNEAVAIPLFAEAPENVRRLLHSLDHAAHYSRKRCLLILVVNAKIDSPLSVHEVNALLLNDLALAGAKETAEGKAFLTLSRFCDVAVIDKASPGRRFPARDGVGLARKLGCDIALRLYHSGQLSSPFISTTDGDAEVAQDYFELPSSEPVAFHRPYLHIPGGDLWESHRLYEISLRYYVESLAFARSPYAFPTIGSTLAVRFDAYTAVRGFPRREAAEDFYLLNKLKKIGAIREGGGIVRLHPRRSTRVPFGTGAATQVIAADLERGKAFTLYHPHIFTCLKSWLIQLESFVKHRDLAKLRGEIAEKSTEEALDHLHTFEALECALKSRPTESSLRKHIHDWFDALKTLRFVHELERRAYPKLPWQEALRIRGNPTPGQEAVAYRPSGGIVL